MINTELNKKNITHSRLIIISKCAIEQDKRKIWVTKKGLIEAAKGATPMFVVMYGGQALYGKIANELNLSKNGTMWLSACGLVSGFIAYKTYDNSREEGETKSKSLIKAVIEGLTWPITMPIRISKIIIDMIKDKIEYDIYG